MEMDGIRVKILSTLSEAHVAISSYAYNALSHSLYTQYVAKDHSEEYVKGLIAYS